MLCAKQARLRKDRTYTASRREQIWGILPTLKPYKAHHEKLLLAGNVTKYSVVTELIFTSCWCAWSVLHYFLLFFAIAATSKPKMFAARFKEAPCKRIVHCLPKTIDRPCLYVGEENKEWAIGERNIKNKTCFLIKLNTFLSNLIKIWWRVLLFGCLFGCLFVCVHTWYNDMVSQRIKECCHWIKHPGKKFLQIKKKSQLRTWLASTPYAP